MGSISRPHGLTQPGIFLPTLLNTQVATQAIAPGQIVTVDAYTCRIYQGQVPELLDRQPARESHLKDTPVYKTLQRVAESILPLRLVDPRSPDFSPDHCRSLHDLGRLVHRTLLHRDVQDQRPGLRRGKRYALKLDAPIPLDLYLIDLGGGLAGADPYADKVTPDQVASVPFQAVLRGMLHEGVRVQEPRPIHLSGLMSVMREQMLAAPNVEERFGDRSYAIISDKYLNFSSRVGYHYSVLDGCLRRHRSPNYITFSFKGGAADDVRRGRRVRAIAIVLMGLDFSVEVQGRPGGRPPAKIRQPHCPGRPTLIGRLLIFTRQMDMLMTSEAGVEAVAQNFLQGNYSLDRGAHCRPPPQNPPRENHLRPIPPNTKSPSNGGTGVSPVQVWGCGYKSSSLSVTRPKRDEKPMPAWGP